MRVLVGCECWGIVRDCFKVFGHDAWSCDLKPSYTPGQHLQCDLLNVLDRPWDLLIAHPDCTYLCSSGLHHSPNRLGRQTKTEEALKFVRKLMFTSHIPKICIENPIGCIGTRIRPPDQIIQPYNFGEDASKVTALWLKGLPLLQATKYVPPRITAEGYMRWANQTDSGQNRLSPGAFRAEDRVRTYVGIALAMTEYSVD